MTEHLFFSRIIVYIIMPATRKRTPNSTTFIFGHNKNRIKMAINDIEELKTEILNLQIKKEEYEDIIRTSKKNRRGISFSSPNHGLMNLGVSNKTKSAQINQQNCVSRIKKKKDKIANLKKSLSGEKDLRGGRKSSTRKSKIKRNNN